MCMCMCDNDDQLHFIVSKEKNYYRISDEIKKIKTFERESH